MMTHYFAAIPVPFELVSEQLSALDSRYDLSSHYKVIPHPDDLHITLLFFGALDSPQLSFVKQEMRSLAAGTDPFSIAIDGVSFFGNPSGPRVVYLSVQPATQLVQLYRQLAIKLESILNKQPSSDYTPHVTIAKKRKSDNPYPIAKERFDSERLDVSSISLYSIDPSASPKYVTECTYPFTGRPSRIVH